MTRDLIGTDLLIKKKRDNSFNIDTILLSNFISIPYNAKEVLDFGCGYGATVLYLSTKTKAHITGIEIQKELCEDAIINIKLNNLEARITILNEDIKNTDKLFRDIDCIISNPPFFKTNDQTRINDLSSRAIARHEIMINLEEILAISSKLLKTNGRLFMIHKSERLTEIIDLCKNHRLSVKRIRFIHPYINSKANRLLLEVHKDGKSEIVIEPPLILYNKSEEITEELKGIYSDNNYKRE